MKKYETPKVEEIKFETEDVIALSSTIVPDITGEKTGYLADWQTSETSETAVDIAYPW